jgi:hypothetical protein
MWQGKGHPPRWADVRQVARNTIDEALRTHSLEQLADIVKGPCREAALAAARNRRDENAQLKREYYNIIVDLVQGEYPLIATPPAPCRIADRRV